MRVLLDTYKLLILLDFSNQANLINTKTKVAKL